MHVISTEVKGKTLFVKEASKRYDKKYLVEYTTDEDEAKRFGKSEAEGLIPVFVNTHDRQFSVKSVAGLGRKKSAEVISDFTKETIW
jgi:hypothetical protein